MKGDIRMFFRIIILGISFVFLLFFTEILIPKIKLKYRLHKELKKKKKRQEAFKKHMEELEIK